MTCVADERNCGGISDLWFGFVPCWLCFRLGGADAVRRRTDR